MKQIVMHLVQTFGLSNINWSAQMMIVKKLLKTYTQEQILFAIDYYAKQGVHIYSMGFFNTKTMDKPTKEYEALNQTKTWSDDSGERNRRKFTENNQTGSRAKYNLDLFEESD